MAAKGGYSADQCATVEIGGKVTEWKGYDADTANGKVASGFKLKLSGG